jgi:hypothetical protein
MQECHPVCLMLTKVSVRAHAPTVHRAQGCSLQAIQVDRLQLHILLESILPVGNTHRRAVPKSVHVLLAVQANIWHDRSGQEPHAALPAYRHHV